MALRVVAIFAFLTTLLFSISLAIGVAGGPPPAPTPACAPAIQPCCPPPCGAMRPPSPFGMCGALLGACTNICGAVIGIPSAVMAGILAPAPRRPVCRPSCGAPPCPPPCAPPTCAPTACAPISPCGPPMCAPPVCVPTGITKCKPPRRTYMRYGAATNPSLSYPTMMAMPMPAPRDPKQDLPGGLKIVAGLMEIPLDLVSGRLVSIQPSSSLGPVATAKVGQGLAGQYW